MPPNIQLEKSIYDRLKNNFKNAKYINLKEINKEEKKECKKIVDYFQNLILNEYDRKASISHIVKTTSGYSIHFIDVQKTQVSAKLTGQFE